MSHDCIVQSNCVLIEVKLLTITFLLRAKNIETVIVARFLQGAFGSTGATMVGGTISDIWLSKEYVLLNLLIMLELFFFVGVDYRCLFLP